MTQFSMMQLVALIQQLGGANARARMRNVLGVGQQQIYARALLCKSLLGCCSVLTESTIV